jgi:ABC-2 type transport system permease protein
MTAPTAPQASGTPGGSPALRSLGTIYRARLRAIATRSRIVLLAALGGLGVLLGLLVSGEGGDAPLELADGFGLLIVVPVTALIFATASLGDAVDDGTLVYLWLRPVPRWQLAAASSAAALTLAWPLVVPALVLATSLAGGDGDLVAATGVAATLALLAYVPLFVSLGLLVRRALVAGLVYVLIWEGAVAGSSVAAARASVRAYMRSVLADQAGADVEPVVGGTAGAVVAALVVAAGSVLAGWWLLQRRDVA